MIRRFEHIENVWNPSDRPESVDDKIQSVKPII